MANGRELWADYLFLTKELERFLKSKDFDLFLELMNQRERLQDSIEGCTDAFPATQEDLAILAEIQNCNQSILQYLHGALNLMKQQQEVSLAYDGQDGSVGAYLDKRR